MRHRLLRDVLLSRTVYSGSSGDSQRANVVDRKHLSVGVLSRWGDRLRRWLTYSAIEFGRILDGGRTKTSVGRPDDSNGDRRED